LVDFIYTDEFKKELERRAKIIYTDNEIKSAMESSGISTIKELVDAETASRPKELMPQAQNLGPIDAWMRK
jgi:hypothetical protein